MPEQQVTLIVFSADKGSTGPERLVAGGKEACARDLIELGLECPLIDRVIVATNSVGLAAVLQHEPRVTVLPDTDGEPFHFGHKLRDIVETHQVRRPLYFGGASAPLLRAETLQQICQKLLDSERSVITNNIWSSDFFGFTPAEALRRVDLPAEQDNNLPFLFSRQGGLRLEQLEQTVETSFDVDTPTDLAVLKLQASVKAHTRAFLKMADIPTATLEATLPLLPSLRAQHALIGRVSTGIWGRPMTDIPGQKRLFVEERGMKASGRAARGDIRSLVGHLLESVGPEQFFLLLAGCADAVFFDTRVVFYHFKLDLTDHDRFASDLGAVSSIRDPVARALTAAAQDCPVPVVLGGQNIVSGALWALAQAAWDRADAGLVRPY